MADATEMQVDVRSTVVKLDRCRMLIWVERYLTDAAATGRV